MGSLQKGKSSHLQKTWMSEQRVLRQPGTELDDWVKESSSALAGGLLGPRHNGDHGTCPIQFNPHRILGARVFLWCPSYRWGNGGPEDWKCQWYSGRPGDLHRVSGLGLSLTHKMGNENKNKNKNTKQTSSIFFSFTGDILEVGFCLGSDLDPQYVNWWRKDSAFLTLPTCSLIFLLSEAESTWDARA